MLVECTCRLFSTSAIDIKLQKAAGRETEDLAVAERWAEVSVTFKA